MDKMKYWLTTMAVLLCSVTVSASIHVEIEGIWYNLYSETEQAEVANNTESVYSGSITIPATVSYEGVNYSVTSIRDYNFIGDGITDITIPESVTSIGYGAFSGCENLTSITIPEGVTSINSSTFEGCRKLTTINIPEGVKSIGEQAFRDCSSLTDITIPKGVTSINSSTFEGCSSLTAITIPENSQLTSIESSAFEGCSGLTTITIPKGVTSIGNEAFRYCSGLITITIPEGVTSIESSVFEGCSGLTTITIPEGVTSIGAWTFDNCENLTTITIPKGVMNIGYEAFSGCSSLTSVTCEAKIPPTTVWNTFNEVSKSIPVYVPANSVEAYKSAEHWSEFTNIQPIIIASGTCGDNLTWELTDDGKLTIEGTGAMYSYGWSDSPLYSHHEFITEVVIPAGVTNIGEGVFWDCTGLTEVTIPAGVTSVDNYAFSGCRNLVSVSVPESVRSIGVYAFQNCNNLTAINIPEGVTSILNYAFENCNSLASITIPAGVTSICSHAFWGCSGLTSIICNAVTPPAVEDEWTLYDVNRSIPVYVPTAAIEDYKSAQYWSEFTNYQSLIIASGICGDNLTWKLTDDGELTIEGEGAMFDFQQDANRPSWDDYQSSIKSVTIKEGVTSIGAWAFSGCALTSISIPEGVVSIGEKAFRGCNNLTSIVTPKSLAVMGTEVFYECGNLLTAEINGSLTAMPTSTFYHCRKLSSVILPSSITSLQWGVFFSCEGLRSLTCLAATPPSCADYSFHGVSTAECVLRIPDMSVSAYQAAAKWKEFVDVVALPLASGTCGGNLEWRLTYSGELIVEGEGEMTSSPSWSEYNGAITVVSLPEGLTSIGSTAFKGCGSLASIIIPEGVTRIENEAFADCSSLTTIVSKATTPPAVANLWTFAGVDKSIPVYVPAVAIEDYKSAYNWSEFTNIQPMIIASGNCGDNLTWKYIDGGELVIEGTGTMNDKPWESYKGSITKVTIKEGVTSIVDWAFYQCSNLTEVSIAESVTHIGNDAFRECSILSSLTLPEGLTHLGSGVFIQCYNLASIIIPDGVRNIYISTFDGCSNLSSVAIPAGMESISGWAFAWCSNLRTIVCKASTPPALDANALEGVNRNAAVYVLNASLEAYRAADGWRNFSNIQPISHSLTVSDAGYATFYLDYAVEIPEEVKVYTATSVAGDRLKMTQVKGLLPAHTGVIVRAEEGTHLFHLSNESPNAIENNLLVGTTENTYIETQSTTKYYVLSRVDGVVGMYRAKIKDNGTFLNNANKAYLALDMGNLGIFDDETNTDEEGGQLSNRLRFDFGGTTGIGNSQLTIDNWQFTIHDLHGRRITDTEGLKGVYIVNGKKVVFK